MNYVSAVYFLLTIVIGSDWFIRACRCYVEVDTSIPATTLLPQLIT